MNDHVGLVLENGDFCRFSVDSSSEAVRDRNSFRSRPREEERKRPLELGLGICMQAIRSGCFPGSAYDVGCSSDTGPPSSAKRILYILRTKAEVSPRLGTALVHMDARGLFVGARGFCSSLVKNLVRLTYMCKASLFASASFRSLVSSLVVDAYAKATVGGGVRCSPDSAPLTVKSAR
ncbi:hypothetical protein BHE74_00022662 [Ensete ventricosum]|nr:hypothetical protein BHE74_00022662 [Ensete ventricosum]